MKIDYYTAALFLNIFAMFSIQICVHKSNTLTKNRKDLFIALFNVIIVAGACDWLGNYLQSAGPETRILHIVVKMIELSLAPITGYLVAWIIEKSHEKIVYTMIGINIVLEILSAFFGFIFKVDANSTYVHAKFYFVYVIMYILSLVYCVGVTLQSVKKYQYSGMSYFLSLALFMLTGVGIKMWNSSLRVDYIALGFTSIMLYVFTLEMINQTDELSGLLNRRGYENYVAHAEEKCAVIFFDINDFKYINDHFGHSVGDIIISEAGEDIKAVYAKYGKCFRYGGDEFCVILKDQLDNIDMLNEAFFDAVEQRRKKEPKFPTLSIGYAFYSPGQNNILDVVEEADQRMYEYKIEYKKRKQS
jgi:diguanylate cyclase (GGDEF)-like protein